MNYYYIRIYIIYFKINYILIFLIHKIINFYNINLKNKIYFEIEIIYLSKKNLYYKIQLKSLY